MWTRIQAAAAGKGLGFANYQLYRLAKASPGRDFYDVTVGDNQPYPAKPGYDNTTGWGTPEVSQLMLDLTGRLTPARKGSPAPVGATATTTCGSLFTDASGDDVYASRGPDARPRRARARSSTSSPARLLLSADGQTLRSIITVKNLTTAIPTGGVENDYNLVFTLGGTQYFTQLAVEPGGAVQAYDGQLLHVSLENRYQQLHVDTGVDHAGRERHRRGRRPAREPGRRARHAAAAPVGRVATSARACSPARSSRSTRPAPSTTTCSARAEEDRR